MNNRRLGNLFGLFGKHRPPSSNSDGGSSRFDSMTDEQLGDQLFRECQFYGVSSDSQHIPDLYDAVVRRIPVQGRMAIEQRVAHWTLYNGLVSALHPFLLRDPDHAVVSTAAVDIASAMPIENGDPMTAPRYLFSMTQLDTTGDMRRAAILCGILVLGDRRVLPIVNGSWRLLSTLNARRALANAQSGATYACIVEFLLDWLEWLGNKDESTFGVVAAALANNIRRGNEPVVRDIERAFPMPPIEHGPAGHVREQWSLQEYARVIEPRLRELERHESEPKVMPDVRRAWGIADASDPDDSISAIAHEARRRCGTEPPFLCVDSWSLSAGQTISLGDSEQNHALVVWGIFNPLGPTVSTMHAVPVPGREETLIYFRWINPFANDACVCALVPTAIAANGQELTRILRPLFARNGPEGHPLFGSLPTYVKIVAGSPLGSDHVRELILAAAEQIAEGNIDATCDLIIQFKGDPWGRTALEFKQALTGMTSTSPSSNPVEVQLQRWWELVSDPIHAKSEASQMRAAYEGAQAFQER